MTHQKSVNQLPLVRNAAAMLFATLLMATTIGHRATSMPLTSIGNGNANMLFEADPMASFEQRVRNPLDGAEATRRYHKQVARKLYTSALPRTSLLMGDDPPPGVAGKSTTPQRMRTEVSY